MNRSDRSEPAPVLAAILAGGRGTRLRGYLEGTPKVLAPAAGKPFLDYLLTSLARKGIRKVFLCTGYLAEKVQAYARDGRQWGLEVKYSYESSPLGTAGALRLASESLNEAFFALNGDTFFNADYTALCELHRSVQAQATLALLPLADPREKGQVMIDKEGKVFAFHEKTGSSKARGSPYLVNAGIYLFEPGALEGVLPGRKASLEGEVFPALAAKGKLGGHVQKGYFADIGTPESLAAFERDIISGLVPGLDPVKG